MDKPRALLDLLKELEADPPETKPWTAGTALLTLDGRSFRLAARECWLLFQSIETVEDLTNILDATDVRVELSGLPVDSDVLDYMREVMDVNVDEAS